MKLPVGWQSLALGELTEPSRVSVPARESGLPYVGLEHVEAQTMRLRGTGESDALKGNAQVFEPNSTLYARLRPYLNKVYAAEFSGVASIEFFVFRPTGGLSPRFLAYLLNSPAVVEFANRHSEGIERPRVAWARLAELPVALPPLAEQRRIVAAIEEQFSRLDATDRSLTRCVLLLDQLRESALWSAMDGEWPTRPMGDVLLRLRNGVFVSRPSPVPPGTPIFRISAVRPLKLAVSDVRYAAVEPESVRDFFVQANDLLFTRYSGNPEYVGACARVPELDQPILHPDKLIRATPDETLVDPAFLELACSAGVTRTEIRNRRKTTAGQVGIAGSQLRSVPVPLPPLEEQRRVVAKLEQQLSLIDSLRAGIEAAKKRSEALRRAILARAFRGELVPHDPNDEPASVLLDRIRAERAAAPKSTRRKRVTA